MVQQVTEGVNVMVETFYQPGHSNPLNAEFLFAYRITIENLSAHPVKLLSRHWHIIDSNGSHREVEGEGVVGEQPVISSGGNYQYSSAVNLHSDIGKMFGNYLIIDLFDKRKIKVTIPEFLLITPFKMN